MKYVLLSYEVDFGMDICVQRDVLVKTKYQDVKEYFEKLKETIEEDDPFEVVMTYLGHKEMGKNRYNFFADTKLVEFDDETIDEED